MNVKEIVMNGYNKIASDYYNHRDLSKFNDLLERFVDLLPEKGHVLDAGCGAGIPASKYLVNKGLKVTGIDISDSMLEMARKNVPNTNFLKMDMKELDFDNDTFDGLISVYSLFHIPKEDHSLVFKRFHEVLKLGGILMINTGLNESEGVSNFFGVPMFWSNYSPKKTLDLIKKSSFSIIFEGILVRGGEYQYWIFAKKE
jgi:ubiquinone/menaquinone biosynthesis C-methylase UbiE